MNEYKKVHKGQRVCISDVKRFPIYGDPVVAPRHLATWVSSLLFVMSLAFPSQEERRICCWEFRDFTRRSDRAIEYSARQRRSCSVLNPLDRFIVKREVEGIKSYTRKEKHESCLLS